MRLHLISVHKHVFLACWFWISNLILTLFSITVQLHIYFKKALKAENMDFGNDGFYSYIFTPLLVFTGMLFTSLVITMCMFIKSQSKFTGVLQYCNEQWKKAAIFFSIGAIISPPTQCSLWVWWDETSTEHVSVSPGTCRVKQRVISND